MILHSNGCYSYKCKLAPKGLRRRDLTLKVPLKLSLKLPFEGALEALRPKDPPEARP